MSQRQTPEQMMASALRFERGLALLNDAAYTFKRFDEETAMYFVHSPNGCYIADTVNGKCTCADFQKTEEFCKHLFGSLELEKQRAQCANAPIEEDVDPYIGSSIGGFDY
jgi:hypothetical protein